jgi:hypothetical protein
MKNSQYNSHDIKTRYENKLKIEFRHTKEYNGWYYCNGKKTNRITVPRGKKFIPPKTYKSIAN